MAGSAGADHMPAARNGRGAVNPRRLNHLRFHRPIRQGQALDATGKFYLPEWRVGREHYTVLGADPSGTHASATRSLRRFSMQARSFGCQLWRSIKATAIACAY